MKGNLNALSNVPRTSFGAGGAFVQSVLERSLGVTGSRVRRIVEGRQLSEEVRSRHQID